MGVAHGVTQGAHGDATPGLAYHPVPRMPHGGDTSHVATVLRAWPMAALHAWPHLLGLSSRSRPVPCRPAAQDTGTATVVGKRGQYVWTDGRDEEALSRGVFRAYTQTNLRYSQVRRGRRGVGGDVGWGVGPGGRARRV